MKKLLFIFVVFSSILMAKEANIIKQKNVLAVHDIIKREELIAQAFEKYLLTEFKLPDMVELRTANYLGTNFSNDATMGNDLYFKNKRTLKLRFAVTKPYENYVYDLYTRDLYREHTSAVVLKTDGVINTSTSYTHVKLQSDEAKNIHAILAVGKEILKDCTAPVAQKYCSKNEEYIRWYNDDLNWVEYSKKDMEFGNVSVSSINFFDANKDRLNELPIGTLIHVENKGKYIKTAITDELKEVN